MEDQAVEEPRGSVVTRRNVIKPSRGVADQSQRRLISPGQGRSEGARGGAVHYARSSEATV